jgi:predicted nucleic acid-binding protein
MHAALKAILAAHPPDADLSLAAVTAAELLVGVELADDQRRHSVP